MIVSTTIRRHAPHRRPRAFTLIETMLALVLGSMVLAGCLAVFLAMKNVETTFAARFARTSELDITHTVLSRALLSLQMDETTSTAVVRAGSEENTTPAEPDPRDRIILEPDPTVAPDSTGWVPQRFEMVCANPPVPAGLATQAASWYTAEDRADTLDFSAMDGSQGITRGVFELRPAGQRERVMQSLGLIGAGDPILAQTDLTNPGYVDPNAAPDWTLWWRPILSAEGQQLQAGYGPYPDTYGDEDDIRARLAGAVPLLRHVQRCIWELFKGDEFIDAHRGLTMSDLPAYAQLEVILTNSQYASWMFEIDWVVGDDPSTAAPGSAAAGADDGTDADGDGVPDGNTGAGPGGGDGTGDGTGNGPGGHRPPGGSSGGAGGGVIIDDGISGRNR